MVDPNIVGISPAGVGELASSFQRRVSETNRLVAAYRGQFASMGVPTASLDAAYRNLGWAEDQIPMLRRRVELAERIDEGVGNPFINLVSQKTWWWQALETSVSLMKLMLNALVRLMVAT